MASSTKRQQQQQQRQQTHDTQRSRLISTDNLGKALYEISNAENIAGYDEIDKEDQNDVLQLCGKLVDLEKPDAPSEITIKNKESYYEIIAFGYSGRISLQSLCRINNEYKVTGVLVGLSEEPSVKEQNKGAIIVTMQKSSAPPPLPLPSETLVISEPFNTHQHNGQGTQIFDTCDDDGEEEEDLFNRPSKKRKTPPSNDTRENRGNKQAQQTRRGSWWIPNFFSQ